MDTGAYGQMYAAFVSSFSYTLAITTVNRIVSSDGPDLLIIAAATSILMAIVALADRELARALADIHQASQNTNQHHVLDIVEGPLQLLLHLTNTASAVLVQFVSSAIGRWVLQLGSSQTLETSVPTVLLGVSLLWLLGMSLGLVRYRPMG